jgi:hypothetical protein
LVERRAAAAATALQQLSEALDQTVFHDLLPESSLTAPSALHGLAAFARQAAGILKDKGGRSRMAAFDLFIRLLADTFGRAAGCPAGLTWSEHRSCYQGRFWELIEHVLPRAKMIAGDGFAPAGDIARGRQVQRVLTRMDKTPPPAP